MNVHVHDTKIVRRYSLAVEGVHLLFFKEDMKVPYNIFMK